jgi:hypothetical protein
MKFLMPLKVKLTHGHAQSVQISRLKIKNLSLAQQQIYKDMLPIIPKETQLLLHIEEVLMLKIGWLI